MKRIFTSLFLLLTFACLQTLNANAASSEVDFVFAELGYNNGAEVTQVEKNGVTLTFAADEKATTPKYYDSGKGIRLYANNSLSVQADKVIEHVEFKFSGSYDFSKINGSTVTVSAGAYSAATGIWTINAVNGTLKVSGSSGNARIVSMKVFLTDGETPGPIEPDPVIPDEPDPDTNPVSFVYADMHYYNAEDISTIPTKGGVSITFDKNEASNGPKYYNTGTAIRMYAGNSLSVESEKEIEKIEFVFDGSNNFNAVTHEEGEAAVKISVGEYSEDGSNGVWTMNSTSGTLNLSGTKGHARIKSMTVYLIEEHGTLTVTLSDVSLALTEGDNETLTANIVKNGEVEVESQVWTSSDDTIATVENGVVTALKAGTATITLTVTDNYGETYTATCAVTVAKRVIAVETIELNATTEKVKIGEQISVKAKVLPDTADDKSLEWTVSDSEILRIQDSDNSVCVLVGEKAGTATVTATAKNGITATVTIIVEAEEPPVVEPGTLSVTLSDESVTLEEGDSETLTANIVKDGEVEVESQVWTSSDDTVATVENGVVTALKAGTTTITLTVTDNYGETYTATCRVTVSKKIIEAESIELNVSSETIKIGEQTSVKAKVLPDTADDKSLEWTVSDSEILRIQDSDNSVCVLVGEKAGTATLTATAKNGITATVTITVEAEEPPVVEPGTLSVTLSDESVTLEEGNSETLTANVVKDGEVEIETEEWISSDETVATVENGVVTALKAGTATIKYAVTDNFGEAYSATCEITVVKKVVEVEEIELKASADIITMGETVNIRATVLPADADDKSIEWSVSDTTVLRIQDYDNTVCVLVGEVAGMATVTATVGNGISASVTIRVEEIMPPVEPGTLTVSLSDNTLALKEGDSETLVATVEKEGDVEVEDEEWSSSDVEVATVENGVVTALKEGTATITYTVTDNYGETYTATCEVIVTEYVGVNGINIDDPETEVYDLNGIRIKSVEELVPGIYIIRKGSAVTKVIVK